MPGSSPGTEAGLLPGLLWATFGPSWRWFQNEGSRGPAPLSPRSLKPTPVWSPLHHTRPWAYLSASEGQVCPLSHSILNHVYPELLSAPLASHRLAAPVLLPTLSLPPTPLLSVPFPSHPVPHGRDTPASDSPLSSDLWIPT